MLFKTIISFKEVFKTYSCELLLFWSIAFFGYFDILNNLNEGFFFVTIATLYALNILTVQKKARILYYLFGAFLIVKMALPVSIPSIWDAFPYINNGFYSTLFCMIFPIMIILLARRNARNPMFEKDLLNYSMVGIWGAFFYLVVMHILETLSFIVKKSLYR